MEFVRIQGYSVGNDNQCIDSMYRVFMLNGEKCVEIPNKHPSQTKRI